jgi:FKBP-type peptidyl-prolyl cis-trans isomerase SlyD
MTGVSWCRDDTYRWSLPGSGGFLFRHSAQARSGTSVFHTESGELLLTTDAREDSGQVVADGQVVSLAYTLRLGDGEEIDAAGADEPLVYLHGAGNIIPGLERELAGMPVGAAKRVKVMAKDAYGDMDPDAYEEVPLDFFPDDMELEEGMSLSLVDQSTGEHIDAYLAELGDEVAVLDLNHPLAGEDLDFEVTIVGVRPATSDELAHGHAHDAHSHH